jgi:hypothetical protein
MKKFLIMPNLIRRMDVMTLRRKVAEMEEMSATASPEARQGIYETHVRLTEEIGRRLATPSDHPLLIKRSGVYTMTADELREQAAEMREAGNDDPAWANTIALLEGEIERRRVISKKLWEKRKAENSLSM